MPVLLRGRPGIDVYDEAVLEGANAIELDFAGAGVSVSYDAATRRATVTVSSVGAPAGRRVYGKEEMHPIGATSQTHGTTPDQMGAYNCATNVVSGVQVNWLVPSDWDGGAVTVVLHYCKITGGTGNIVHQLNTSKIDVGDGIGEAGVSTQQTVAVAADPALTRQLVTWAAEFTPAAVGEFWRINYRRLGPDVADTYNFTAGVIAIELQYTSS